MGYKPLAICHMLREEGLIANQMGQMRDDDEMTAVQLHTLKTVLTCQAALGWTFRGSAYFQLICQQNKLKCLQWAQEHLSEGVAATGREGVAATGCELFFIILFSFESFCGRFIQR